VKALAKSFIHDLREWLARSMSNFLELLRQLVVESQCGFHQVMIKLPRIVTMCRVSFSVNQSRDGVPAGAAKLT